MTTLVSVATLAVAALIVAVCVVPPLAMATLAVVMYACNQGYVRINTRHTQPSPGRPPPTKVGPVRARLLKLVRVFHCLLNLLSLERVPYHWQSRLWRSSRP